MCSDKQHPIDSAMERSTGPSAFEASGEAVAAAGDGWWLEIGPVDLDAELVTIQRGDVLIAAIVGRADGRLRVSVFHALDAKSKGYLTGLGQVPHPDHGVCMRENNWQYALDCSAGSGNFHASQRGESYLSYWERGLGISQDGAEVPEWRKQLALLARPAAEVFNELRLVPAVVDGTDSEANEKAVGAAAAGEQPGWNARSVEHPRNQEHFRGCLLGGAVGDALGAPVEFMQRAEILRRFGLAGVTHYEKAYGGLGKFTDDTQMTLFTAEGLLRGWVRQCFKGITSYSGVTAHAYLRWLLTQGERSALYEELGPNDPGWLIQQRDLHQCRAPGNTCLSALREMTYLGEPARNDSKGCGGVMRVAPVGLFTWRLHTTPEETFQLAEELAALTHGHPTGSLTGGVLAVLLAALLDDASLSEALGMAKAILRSKSHHGETMQAMESAEALSVSGLPHEEAIARLGQGWIAEEALAIAIYCALVADSFEQGVTLAVNHDGDSDSTGSIVGNLLGAIHGVNAIPRNWLEPLELREVIVELADDLFAFKDWEIGDYSKHEEMNERIWQKYPGV